MHSWNRQYELTVSTPLDVATDRLSTVNPTPVTSELEGSPEQVVRIYDRVIGNNVITNLQMTCKFNSVKNSKAKPFAEITLYNASSDIIRIIRTPDAVLHLKAGYRTNLKDNSEISTTSLPTILYGDIVASYTEREGSDIITTIRVAEGSVPARESYVSKWYTFDYSLQEIVTDLIQNYYEGMSVGEINLTADDYARVEYAIGENEQIIRNSLTVEPQAFGETRTGRLGLTTREYLGKARKSSSGYDYAYVAFGKTRDVLEDLAKDFRFQLYEIKNKLYARPIGLEKIREVFTIAPNQVVGTVETAQSSARDTNKSENIVVKVFLEGSITIDSYVRLLGFNNEVFGTFIDGDYAVESVKHDLDYRGKDWYTNLTLRRITDG